MPRITKQNAKGIIDGPQALEKVGLALAFPGLGWDKEVKL